MSICFLIFGVSNASFLSPVLNLLSVVIKLEINRLLTDVGTGVKWSVNSLKLYAKLSVCKCVPILGENDAKVSSTLKRSKKGEMSSLGNLNHT